ncbi:MAG: ATP-binding protein [Nitrospirota bacterium]|nr:ATP-binding protein [Nitrospirota bacterium]
MEDLSLHILDIVENSIAAGANRVEIRVIEDTKKDILSVEIRDNGKGMSEEVLGKAIYPFYTTRTTRRVGLGLSLLSQSAKEAEGDMAITSKKGEGTIVIADFKHSHIDRKPLGNMAETLIVLIAGNPDIDFLYEHRLNNRAYSIDTKDIREELGDVPLSSPDVIKAIKKDIQNGLKILSS